MFAKQLLALALAVAGSEAVYQGFNYGNINSDGSGKSEADFKTEFDTAKNLVGTSGFTSARLYTMIQGGTTNDPIQAIPAAIGSDTSLLLGLWASGDNMDNEIAALKSAINTYGDSLGKLVAGISVGSEDLYRNSVTGVKNHAGIGTNPDVLVQYIKDVRSAISGTALSSASIGHVDTWDAWTNSSNAAVIQQIDWLGFDGYPYFQVSMQNGIDNAKALFDEAWQKTVSVAGGRPVWMTETGWPVSGPTMHEAVPSIANAKTYWDEVACPLLGNTNTWWYTLEDAGSSPSFGVTSGPTDTTPLFDLRCPSSSSSSGAAAGSASSSVAPSSAASSSAASSSAASSSAAPSSAASSSAASSSAASSSAASSSAASSSAAPSSAASSSAPAASTSVPCSTPVASSAMSSSAASGFASSTAVASSTPLTSATSTPGSGSAGSGSSTSGASSPSGTPAFNSANRATGSSIFGAVASVLALAIAV